MNPSRLFREVLESHEFRLSDNETKTTIELFPAYPSTSDNANLLDIVETCKVGRFVHYMVGKNAATG